MPVPDTQSRGAVSFDVERNRVGAASTDDHSNARQRAGKPQRSPVPANQRWITHSVAGWRLAHGSCKGARWELYRTQEDAMSAARAELTPTGGEIVLHGVPWEIVRKAAVARVDTSDLPG
jgi:hypothetical protein